MAVEYGYIYGTLTVTETSCPAATGKPGEIAIVALAMFDPERTVLTSDVTMEVGLELMFVLSSVAKSAPSRAALVNTCCTIRAWPNSTMPMTSRNNSGAMSANSRKSRAEDDTRAARKSATISC